MKMSHSPECSLGQFNTFAFHTVCMNTSQKMQNMTNESHARCFQIDLYFVWFVVLWWFNENKVSYMMGLVVDGTLWLMYRIV